MVFGIRATMLAGAACILSIGTVATAQSQVSVRYDLPSQDLGSALRQFSRMAGIDIMFQPDDVKGLTAPPIRGDLTPAQAIDRVLSGTALEASFAEGGVVIRGRPTPSRGEGTDATTNDPDIVVTGSRIRGAPIASPVITVGAEDIRNQGKFGLGEVVRAIPQSFGGGQNPGIGIGVPAASGVDVGGGSSINLRGLGSDATLTLLDGRRLAFNASRQSIDVSAVPIGAVERLEIVPDGASALYGSDAVAGVANIILRRKFDGFEVGARIGAASDGGNFQQQYSATGGLDWGSGNLVAAYEHGSNSVIIGRQRSYAQTKPGLTLFPKLRHDNVSIAADQRITDTLTFVVDALFNSRHSESTFPTLATGDIRQARTTNFFHDRSWAIAPSFRLALGDWRVALSGDIGRERVNLRQVGCLVDVCSLNSTGFYRNSQRSAELGADGPLFALPGGDAKIAFGAGYRTIGYERFSPGGTAVNTKRDQDSYFGYGELDLPIVGAAQGLSFVERLNVTGAVRYERYPGIGGVATPKVGLIYAPTSDFDLKASWGRSYRAPTLFQQYQPRTVVIYPPVVVGGTGFPANAGALYVIGGNPALKPERARTWSATLAVHPRSLPGARLEVSYFNIAYRDRIVAPIAFVSQALSNPLFAAQITRNPDAAAQAAVIAGASTVINATGIPYNAANIIAIVDNASVNAGRQSAKGVDVLARYRFALAETRTLDLSVNASYLKSSQQISAAQPTIPLAGRIFSPPHWRGQGTAAYGDGPVSVAATLSLTGGVLDARRTVSVPVDGLTTLDLTARYRVEAASGPLRGVELTFGVANFFNAKPDVIVAPAATETPYDSTNYSPVGRLVSVGISKRF